MVFYATFNNISVISCSVLLVEETGVLGENHWPACTEGNDDIYYHFFFFLAYTGGNDDIYNHFIIF
jgi:hypothetical protein